MKRFVHFQTKSIRLKIALWSGAALLVMAVLLSGYAIWTIRSAALQQAKEKNLNLARAKATTVEATINHALFTARTLASTLSSGLNEISPISRAQANGILRQVLMENPEFLGVYTLWEPNAFDGKDENLQRTYGHDETGRFIPYWVRSDGEIILEPLLNYEVEGDGDYYLIPKKTGREAVLDPYIYPIDGQDVLLTSVVAPIIVDGKFYGIAGVDLPLSTLQELTGLEIYNGAGELLLISHNGVLAGVTDRPDLAGTSLSDFSGAWVEQLANVRAGEEKVSVEGSHLAVFAPVYLGDTQTPWSVNVNIPMAAINSEVYGPMLRMAAI
ncbi:MAG TPA: hypothetical protein VLS48_04190, partial [Anaerolineales bacterium]|nr:hypothetical protein [Anaerolineales bacterium]